MFRAPSIWIGSLLLAGMSIGRGDTSAAVPASAIVSDDAVHQTVDRATAYLQKESADWAQKRVCAACHHTPMAIWGLSEAKQNGYSIDDKYLADTVESVLGNIEKLRASRIFPDPKAPPDPRPQGRGLNMGLPFLAVAASAFPDLTENQKESLKLVVGEIITKQQSDGSWEFFQTLRRPPINETQYTDVAWIIMALDDIGKLSPDDSIRGSLAKARTWLESSHPAELHQEKAMQLILDVRASNSTESIASRVKDLLALQREDGGWSQSIPERKSDAFATGQTLYALSLAGMKKDDPAIQRGIDFLVKTQSPDGSWPMASRSTPDGSPGSSKLLTPINCASAAWAVLGLTSQVPVKK